MTLGRLLFLVIGAAAAADGAVCGAMANFNIGFIAEILCGAVCLLFGILWNKTRMWLKAALAVGIAALLCGAVALWSYGSYDTANFTEDVLIVLGAGVQGETPTMVLANRLDTATEYLKKNPYASVIVSGGQGPQEAVTEAAAMEKYLIGCGIAGERIIKEERATSTAENFRYSKQIADERFPSARIATVTNDFHIYRAKRIAKKEGIETTVLHAKTPPYGMAAMYLREMLAVAKLLVLGA